ncbi:MAG: S1C family serine protease [Odoribacter sp.]|nr:S1C family serine protease [Odoribacter sp.]
MKEDMYEMEERVKRLKAWLDGKLTAEEAAEFEEWLERHPADRKLLERMEGMEALAARMRFCERNDREAGWKNIQRRIRRSALIRRFGRSAAAVMAFGMLAGGAWYYAGMEKDPVLLVQEKVHIVPGSSQAYLELATGEQFVLDSMRGVDTRVDGAVMKTQEAGQLVVSGDSDDKIVKQVQ